MQASRVQPTTVVKKQSRPTLPLQSRIRTDRLPALPNRNGLFSLKGQLVEVKFWVFPDLVNSAFYYYSLSGEQLGYVETVVNTKGDRVIFRIFDKNGDRIPRCEYDSYNFLDAQ